MKVAPKEDTECHPAWIPEGGDVLWPDVPEELFCFQNLK